MTTVQALAETMSETGYSRQTVFLVLPGETGPETVSRLYDETFAHGWREAR